MLGHETGCPSDFKRAQPCSQRAASVTSPPPPGIPAASLVLFIGIAVKAKSEKWFRQVEGWETGRVGGREGGGQ